MGATTYRWTLDHHFTEHPEQWQEFYDDRPCWVFTHRDLPGIPGVDVHFVSGDVSAAYDELSRPPAGSDIWVVGGGDLVGQFDDAGLLDEIESGDGPGDPRRRPTPAAPPDHLAPAELPRGAPVGQRVRIILDVASPEYPRPPSRPSGSLVGEGARRPSR